MNIPPWIGFASYVGSVVGDPFTIRGARSLAIEGDNNVSCAYEVRTDRQGHVRHYVLLRALASAVGCAAVGSWMSFASSRGLWDADVSSEASA